MEEFERKERGEVYSRPVRAGKRTYFFDVKEMRSGEMYVIITESKKRFNEENGQFFYEKHKLFLYQEDFDKFRQGLEDVFHFIRTGEKVPEEEASECVEHSDFVDDTGTEPAEM